MKPTDFYTRPRSEEGVKVPLLLPSGADSGEWVIVKGPGSRSYRRAQSVFTRGLAELGSLPEEEREERAETLVLEFLAPLVSAWSFSEPLTLDAVTAFLENAPDVTRRLDLVINDTARFMGPGSGSSTSGPESSETSGAAAGTPSKDGSDSTHQNAPESCATSSESGGSSARAA